MEKKSLKASLRPKNSNAITTTHTGAVTSTAAAQEKPPLSATTAKSVSFSGNCGGFHLGQTARSTAGLSSAAKELLAIKNYNNNYVHHHSSHPAIPATPGMGGNRAAGHLSVAPAVLQSSSSVNYAKSISPRNKNEEAINDLRRRIPEIETIFDIHSRIGNGTFSTVLLGTLKRERDLPENMRRKFAIKHHIPTSHPDRIMKELQCMAKMGGSENVIGINCCIRYNESVAFIMPYMPHDRFHEFFGKMDLVELQNYMRNLLIALRHVHKFNIIHRDVKPSNFLYNRRKRQFLLVDFGLAQQVPQAGPAAIELNNNGGAVTVPAIMGAKRLREEDEALTARDAETALAMGDTGGSSKRLRSVNGDAQEASSARGINSCGAFSGGPHFKMPLKQLNEINLSKTAGLGSASGICETPTSRQVKSAILSTTLTARLQDKKQEQGAATTDAAAAASAVPGSVAVGGAPAAGGESPGHATLTRYNTNRSVAGSNASVRCSCFGHSTVCNVCLVKKEIHASRAGTPGYRPPEVLLKYPDQTTAVDIWASGVIFLSMLSSVYPFFKAPNDYVALAEMVTIFGDKAIRKTAFHLDRLVTLNQKTKPLDLRKLCVRFRNRNKFSSPALLKKYQRPDGTCEVCKNCDQYFFNCLCDDSLFKTEPFEGDDTFPASAYDLLSRLLEVNPHKRITAEEALRHPFFSEKE